MTILNPCRKCLVKPICRYRCDKRQNYWDTIADFWNYLSKVLIIIAMLTIFSR
jgi:hypothetical protein